MAKLVFVVLTGVVSLQSALVFWLNEGVDGVQLSGVERVAAMVPSLWADIRAIVQNGTADQTKRLEVMLSNTDQDRTCKPANISSLIWYQQCEFMCFFLEFLLVLLRAPQLKTSPPFCPPPVLTCSSPGC